MYGLNGHVWVFPHTDHPEQFLELKTLRVANDIFDVSSAVFQKGRILLKLKGIDHINEAEKYRGERIYIKSSDRIELDEDEYSYDDLLGMTVITESGEDLGKIENIIRTGANDVYETGSAMIPAVKEFVKAVDVKNKKMVVIDRTGLKKEER